MVLRELGFPFIRVNKLVVIGGCVVSLLSGCSSSIRTTIVSGSEAQKVQVAQLEPETIVAEEVVAQPVQKETRLDIPIEEPARPAPRREFPAEIFATPKSKVAPSEISTFSESPSPVPVEEPVASSMPVVSAPSIESPSSGIPPVVFEPEMPALPTLRENAGSPISQEAPIEVVAIPEVPALVPQPEEPAQTEIPSIPEPPVRQEPVQVAKVMPQEPAQTEIIEEALKAALNDVYFDYDRFSIRDDAFQVLKANAALLSEKLADKKIVIEGHCDERGTQSYNMVLGEARANSVKSFLEDLGVSGDKLEVVSYGKDRPFCMEQTEECWQENRRGHFVIK
jgi:peptidoglycan-associated lipoprotein